MKKYGKAERKADCKIYKKYRNDIFIIIIICLLALGIYLVNSFGQSASKAGEVLVYADGTLVGQYSLLEESEYRIESEFGFCFLVIDNNEAYVSEADCRDALCVSQGRISKNKQSIICLPNRIVIEVVNTDKEGEFDAIAY